MIGDCSTRTDFVMFPLVCFISFLASGAIGFLVGSLICDMFSGLLA